MGELGFIWGLPFALAGDVRILGHLLFASRLSTLRRSEELSPLLHEPRAMTPNSPSMSGGRKAKNAPSASCSRCTKFIQASFLVAIVLGEVVSRSNSTLGGPASNQPVEGQ